MKKKFNLLVIGGSGQLGNEFKRESILLNDHNFYFPNLKEVDIANYNSILNFIKKHKINVIINCAAYTNVSLAEKEKKKCLKVNEIGVKNLVNACELCSIKLIHFSTDYVYNGKRNKPLDEEAVCQPINFYGYSKRIGEKHIENSKIESIIIRTSWLYSKFGKNFVNTIIEKAKKENSIKVVDDEFGSPTYARDLAKTTLQILLSYEIIDGKNKIYNFSNLGQTSWFNFAKKIITIYDLKCKILPISSDSFQSAVNRPKYSVMDKSRIINDFDVKINSWQKSLKNYIKNDLTL